jgi:hypothetical protein
VDTKALAVRAVARFGIQAMLAQAFGELHRRLFGRLLARRFAAWVTRPGSAAGSKRKAAADRGCDKEWERGKTTAAPPGHRA